MKQMTNKFPVQSDKFPVQDILYAYALSEKEINDLVIADVVEVSDGCRVEPDGCCPHGRWSPLVVLGLI